MAKNLHVMLRFRLHDTRIGVFAMSRLPNTVYSEPVCKLNRMLHRKNMCEGTYITCVVIFVVMKYQGDRSWRVNMNIPGFWQASAERNEIVFEIGADVGIRPLLWTQLSSF